MSDQQRVITPRIVIQLLVFIVAAPFLPLLISRRWSWWEAWAYAIISILGFAISRILAVRRHPDLITERAQHLQQENIKPWDKRLSGWPGRLMPSLPACGSSRWRRHRLLPRH